VFCNSLFTVNKLFCTTLGGSGAFSGHRSTGVPAHGPEGIIKAAAACAERFGCSLRFSVTPFVFLAASAWTRAVSAHFI